MSEPARLRRSPSAALPSLCFVFFGFLVNIMKFQRGGAGLYRGEAKIALPQGGKGAACKIPGPPPPICRRPPAQYKIALAEGGKGAACKIPCPPRRPFAGGPPHSRKSPSRRAARGPPANFVDGRRPRANGRLPRHFRRPLGWRFLKIALPKGGRRLLPPIFKMENYFCKTFNKKNYK